MGILLYSHQNGGKNDEHIIKQHRIHNNDDTGTGKPDTGNQNKKQTILN